MDIEPLPLPHSTQHTLFDVLFLIQSGISQTGPSTTFAQIRIMTWCLNGLPTSWISSCEIIVCPTPPRASSFYFNTYFTIPPTIPLYFCSNMADVHHSCNMKHKGFVLEVSGGRHYMTSSQHTLIKIYKVVTVLTGLIILIAYFGPGLYKLFKILFIGHIENPLPPTSVKFSDVEV
jgi:hypothetical protein